MKVGDLVKERHAKADWQDDHVGVIIEVKHSQDEIPDYRSQDSFLVLYLGVYLIVVKSQKVDLITCEIHKSHLGIYNL